MVYRGVGGGSAEKLFPLNWFSTNLHATTPNYNIKTGQEDRAVLSAIMYEYMVPMTGSKTNVKSMLVTCCRYTQTDLDHKRTVDHTLQFIHKRPGISIFIS